IPLYGPVGGMGQDIPAFAAQTYDLFISDATSIKSVDFRSEIYPNPSNSDFTIEVNSPMNLIIYNNLGQRVYSEKIINNIKINKSEMGSGIFIVEISDNNSVEKHKLIIN
ncbi:MAG: T9SS type A sorting domain-containing protein, partial [Flavobacteriales bacterium]